jgi:hypothetical protein
MNIEKAIDEIIEECETEQSKLNSNPYFPDIILSLKQMREIIIIGSGHSRYSKAERSKIAGALGRIITEDFSFSESMLGSKLLNIADEFASNKSLE